MTPSVERAAALSESMRLLSSLVFDMSDLFPLLKSEGLSQHHVWILHAITREGDLTMSELARRIKLSDSSATVLVDALEQKKLVVRLRSDSDRRVVKVTVTKSGRKLGEEMERGLATVAQRMLDVLDEGEQAEYLRLTEKITQKLKQSIHSRTDV